MHGGSRGELSVSCPTGAMWTVLSYLHDNGGDMGGAVAKEAHLSHGVPVFSRDQSYIHG